jgi:hypothetical protein
MMKLSIKEELDEISNQSISLGDQTPVFSPFKNVTLTKQNT